MGSSHGTTQQANGNHPRDTVELDVVTVLPNPLANPSGAQEEHVVSTLTPCDVMATKDYDNVIVVEADVKSWQPKAKVMLKIANK